MKVDEILSKYSSSLGVKGLSTLRISKSAS